MELLGQLGELVVCGLGSAGPEHVSVVAVASGSEADEPQQPAEELAPVPRTHAPLVVLQLAELVGAAEVVAAELPDLRLLLLPLARP